MKRIVTLLLAGGMLMGSATASQAVDVKVKGYWQFGFEWGKVAQVKPKTSDTFNVVQRFRSQVDFIASESLKGVVFFEIGKVDWGKGGAGVGSDAKDVKVRYSYVDWMVPQTDLKVRMGIQPFILPNFVAGDNVLGVDAAGITLSYQFNDMVGATLFWTRASDDGYNSEYTRPSTSFRHDSADFFGLTVPVKGDGFKVTPWGMMGSVGRNSLDGVSGANDIDYVRQGLLPYGASGAQLASSNDRSGTPWWLGIGGELTMFNPFRIAAEFRYGSADLGNMTATDMGASAMVDNVLVNNFYKTERNITKFDFERSGWYAGLIAEYKLDFMTPGLIFWYTSGDDGNPYNGSERMPIVYASTSSWAPTNFGFDGAADVGTSRMYDAIGANNVGTWGVVAQLKDITFLEDLKHTLKFGFYQGTNNKNMPARAGMTAFYALKDGLYMTTKDNAWEVDFVTNYQIYKDLAVSLDLAYIRLDMDKSVWEPALGSATWNKREKNNYRAGVYMQYNF